MLNAVNCVSSANKYNADNSKNFFKGAQDIAPTKNVFGDSFGYRESSRGTVYIEGKEYPVITTSGGNGNLGRQVDVVVVDGKSYPLKKVRDCMTCDGTKYVIAIDGKQYDVEGRTVGASD